MDLDLIDKVLDVKESLAVRLNPGFYQLINKGNDSWFFERFINIVSYEQDDRLIIDFTDNNEDFYGSRINTKHVYRIEDVPNSDFYSCIVNALLDNQYINIWCDEFYIRDSIRFQRTHFVHPLTIYGVSCGKFLCEFFAVHKGMCLIEIPAFDLCRAFYSIQNYYLNGASEEILNKAIQMYTVKQTDEHPFSINLFVDELNNYLHSQISPYRIREGRNGIKIVAYGIAYYNELLKMVYNHNCLALNISYKCLFDLLLHKKFLLERFKYVKGHLNAGDDFDIFIVQMEEIVKLYERINLLNLKYNIQKGRSPYILSQDTEFRKKLGEILERSYILEIDLLTRTIPFIIDKMNSCYGRWKDSFEISTIGDDLIIRPLAEDYVDGLYLKFKPVSANLPVSIQLSNGYLLLPYATDVVNTYKFRPAKLKWIKITNCQMPDLFGVNKLSDIDKAVLDECKISNWHPMNDISNWYDGETYVSFDINGVDPYLVCDRLAIDSNKYRYISIEYLCDSIAPVAQLYFFTDESPNYTVDKCINFNRITENRRYVYKIDLSDCSSWNNLITFIRLDPIDSVAALDSKEEISSCFVYNILVSSIPNSYCSEVDFCGSQAVNQWEYNVCINGELNPLSYDASSYIWRHSDCRDVFIGRDSQKGLSGYKAVRSWVCPSQGEYKVKLIANSDMISTFLVKQGDENILYENRQDKDILYESNIMLEKGDLIHFASESLVTNLLIEIVKTTQIGLDEQL